MKRRIFTFIITFLLFCSCNNTYRPASVQWKDYRITNTPAADTTMLQLLKPYSDSINSTMNRVLAQLAVTLEKKQPEGTLGSFMADAMLQMALEKFNQPVHAAFINNGGVRINSLQAGPVTVGKIYELMPFDNMIVLQKMNGAAFRQLLNHIAKRGGWPAAGIRFRIQDNSGVKTAVDIYIDNEPLDDGKDYTIANSDYIANGGDDCDMLRSIPALNRNILLRDALIEYTARLGKRQQSIIAPAGNRITNQP